jgi:uncharacterized OB-fold protein
MAEPDVLEAPNILEYPYARSVGPIIGRFMGALRNRRFLGIRAKDGHVICPPTEYDPDTGEELTADDLVEVGPNGEVTTWAWVNHPREKHPLDHPFAWALIGLDGADTALLHVVDAADEIVEKIDTPIELRYRFVAGHAQTMFLRGIEQGKILGQRCPVCHKVYCPPRGACASDGVALGEEPVEVSDKGTVTTFCVVNVPFYDQKMEIPYVSATILLDGADIGMMHLIQEAKAEDVHMGMRVEAVWAPPEEREPTLESIKYFRPTGEPDADYDSYREHV